MPIIRYDRVIDLTWPLAPDMPVWPGDPPLEYKTMARLDREGYALRSARIGEHLGSHLNAPAHFLENGETVEAIPPDRLVSPCVVVPLARENGADGLLEPEDVRDWENRHGRIPPGSIVLVRTGWGRLWNDPDAFLGLDGRGGMRFPGVAAEAARLLMDRRGASGMGIDTHGLDSGADQDFAANKAVLSRGGLVLECLANLETLPPTGAVLFMGALPLAGGSGAPARVLALAG